MSSRRAVIFVSSVISSCHQQDQAIRALRLIVRLLAIVLVRILDFVAVRRNGVLHGIMEQRVIAIAPRVRLFQEKGDDGFELSPSLFSWLAEFPAARDN